MPPSKPVQNDMFGDDFYRSNPELKPPKKKKWYYVTNGKRSLMLVETLDGLAWSPHDLQTVKPHFFTSRNVARARCKNILSGCGLSILVYPYDIHW